MAGLILQRVALAEAVLRVNLKKERYGAKQSQVTDYRE
jgi:hypothetical protein